MPYRQPLLSIVRDVALAAAHHGVAPRAAIAAMLTKYIPDPSRTYFSNFSSEPKSTIISAQCLRAKLAGDNIKLEDLAKSEIREELAKDRQVHSREAREFLDEVGPVFRWHMLWASVQLGEAITDQLNDEITLFIEDYNKNLEYRDRDRRHIAVDSLKFEIVRFLAFKAALKQRTTYQQVGETVGWNHPNGRGLGARLEAILNYLAVRKGHVDFDIGSFLVLPGYPLRVNV